MLSFCGFCCWGVADAADFSDFLPRSALILLLLLLLRLLLLLLDETERDRDPE